MKKMFTYILVISLLFNLIVDSKTLATDFNTRPQSNSIYNITMKQDLLCLMLAYAEYITTIESKDGYISIVMKSGKKLCYDDRLQKTLDKKLINPDLQDTLEQSYPLTRVKTIMEENYDPGRYRCYGLLSQVYGTSKQVIEYNLTKVNVGYNNYQFNKSNGASSSLQTVMKELNTLAQSDSNLRKCFLPCSGTFNYRVISGTNRLSPHAYGIAIDLASDKRDYWKWASKEQGAKRLISYSNELVEVFEKNGFVWGGKWSHFDILHFEYRPEIILKSRYFKGHVNIQKPWYEGAPTNEEPVKNIIEKIDKIIGV